jgi:manganese/zinc/iron transport system permease protein
VTAELEILAIAVVTAVAAALPGTYLVLRRTAMVSDAIAHAILPGIVLAFLFTRDLSSPLLLVAAAATGVLTVALIEVVVRSRLVPEDASIGIVFPALFSLGVILISRAASDVHLDTDAVLLGELAFAPFNRFAPGGIDLGPAALWSMGAILVLDALFIGLAWKELKLATVDASLAALLGFRPALVHYGLMTMVSLTAVGAFDAVGSILVVALMIAPPATAYLLTERLGAMVGIAVAAAAVAAAAGWAAALALDVSIAGAIAGASGLLFAVAFLTAPRRGLLAQARRRSGQRLDFSVSMLLVHLLHHEGTPVEAEECRERSLHRHLGWRESWTRRVVGRARERGLVARDGEVVLPTDAGRRLADRAVIGFSR